MKLYIPNTKEQYIILFDIEYDNSLLVQLAFLILTRTTEPNIYVLSKSVNLYVKQDRTLSSFFTKYTHIFTSKLNLFILFYHHLTLNKINVIILLCKYSYFKFRYWFIFRCCYISYVKISYW